MNPAPRPEPTTPEVCTRCGARFDCGMRSGHCWCQALPVLRDLEPGQACYCPACLKALTVPAVAVGR